MFVNQFEEKILAGVDITAEEAASLAAVEGPDVFDLAASAGKICRRFRGDFIDLCSIVNAKSGACPEDCSYCAQSSRSATGISVYPLVETALIIEKAVEALEGGARRFCIVTSGRKPSGRDLDRIAAMISEVKKIGLLPCATLGLLDEQELTVLRDAGLVRYHHNLETSEEYFPNICTTHSFEDKLRTIAAVKKAGLSLCSGGIFGVGEDWQDRISMAMTLRGLDPDSVPVNFLIPVKGTGLGGLPALPPLEALKIISIYRMILPRKEIRICGGRVQALGELGSHVFTAGADGLLTGNYLTTSGRSFIDDLRLIDQCGLSRDASKKPGHEAAV